MDDRSLPHRRNDAEERRRNDLVDEGRRWANVTLWQADRVRAATIRLESVNDEMRSTGIYDQGAFHKSAAERFFLLHAARQLRRAIVALTLGDEPARARLLSPVSKRSLVLRDAWEHWDDLNDEGKEALASLGQNAQPEALRWSPGGADIVIGNAVRLDELSEYTRWTLNYLELLADSRRFSEEGWTAAPPLADPPELLEDDRPGT